MPINQIDAFVVECDICHRTLTVAGDTIPNASWQIASFLTPANARAAAIWAHWTLGRELVACPKCSPTTGAPPTLTPAPGARRDRELPGPAAES